MGGLIESPIWDTPRRLDCFWEIFLDHICCSSPFLPFWYISRIVNAVQWHNCCCFKVDQSGQDEKYLIFLQWFNVVRDVWKKIARDGFGLKRLQFCSEITRDGFKMPAVERRTSNFSEWFNVVRMFDKDNQIQFCSEITRDGFEMPAVERET